MADGFCNKLLFEASRNSVISSHLKFGIVIVKEKYIRGGIYNYWTTTQR
jgi:hypothetical protein